MQIGTAASAVNASAGRPHVTTAATSKSKAIAKPYQIARTPPDAMSRAIFPIKGRLKLARIVGRGRSGVCVIILIRDQLGRVSRSVMWQGVTAMAKAHQSGWRNANGPALASPFRRSETATYSPSKSTSSMMRKAVVRLSASSFSATLSAVNVPQLVTRSDTCASASTGYSLLVSA